MGNGALALGGIRRMDSYRVGGDGEKFVQPRTGPLDHGTQPDAGRVLRLGRVPVHRFHEGRFSAFGEPQHNDIRAACGGSYLRPTPKESNCLRRMRFVRANQKRICLH